MIEREIYIPISPDLVWEKLVHNEHIKKWWNPEVSLEPIKNGSFSEHAVEENGKSFNVSGTVTAFEPARRLQLDYRRHEWPRAMRIEFLLSPEKPGSRLYLQHSGWDVMPDEKQRNANVDFYTKAWAELLKKFEAYCIK